MKYIYAYMQGDISLLKYKYICEILIKGIINAKILET